MNTFNAVFTTLFDALLGWFGSVSAWVDILFWSLLGGIVALLVYKNISNQKGIEKAKNDIKVHLMEIRLFQDDLWGVLVSTAKILFKNTLYIGHNILPMVVMFLPMMGILCQLEANYAFDPMKVGTTTLVTLDVDRSAAPIDDLATSAITMTAPPGVTVLAKVPAPNAVAWQVRFDQPGDYDLAFQLGDEQLTKGVAVGGEARKVPVIRTKGLLDLFLYPGEEGLPDDSAAYSISFSHGAYPETDFGWMPGGEGGILMTFFVLSIAAGLALKGVFGVTL
ncbi:MAG: hypothetical protein ACI9EF_000287 [Pseudohongiellaceae bacterium]|jgi:hypothetical protein